jgi:hypothetical protein
MFWLTGTVKDIASLPALLEGGAMIHQTQMNRVALANQLPVNKVAIAFLPDDWRTSTEVAVLMLMLMRWGLDSGLGRYLTDRDLDQMVSRINRMENWESSAVQDRRCRCSSRSAMKGSDANIRRGTAAMNKALLDKTTVHRAMFRNGLG